LEPPRDRLLGLGWRTGSQDQTNCFASRHFG
jgi:hypothetical protein